MPCCLIWMHLLDDFEKNRQTRVWAWDRKGEYKVTEKDELQGEKGERTWIGGEKKRVVWDKKRKIFFSERSEYIIKRMHFRHLQWSLQLYLKFARQCMKCYCCCSPPGNRPYPMWCWYQFSVSSVVWKTTAMKIIAGPLTSEFVHLSGIIVKLVLLPLTWRWMQFMDPTTTLHGHV